MYLAKFLDTLAKSSFRVHTIFYTYL